MFINTSNFFMACKRSTHYIFELYYKELNLILIKEKAK
jgi:hypothetical protein